MTPAVPVGLQVSRSPFGRAFSLLVCEQQQHGATFCAHGKYPDFLACLHPIAIILKLYVEQEVLTRAA